MAPLLSEDTAHYVEVDSDLQGCTASSLGSVGILEKS